MRLKVAILFLLLLISPLYALTWSEVVELAPQVNHDLKSAEQQLKAEEWGYKKSLTTFFPQLSANASVTNSPSGSAWTQSYSYGLSLSQNLFQGMEAIYSIQSAYEDVVYQQASLRSTKSTVFYDLRQAFIEMLNKQEEVKLFEGILKQRQQNSRLIQLRYDSGKEDKGNLLATKASEASAEYDLASVKRDLKLARLKLSQLLEQEVDQVEAVEDLVGPTETDFAQLLPQTPAYVMAQSQLKSAEIADKATIAGFLPSLSLSASYSKRGSQWPPAGSSSKSWSLSLSMPIFPGGSNIADKVIYRAKLDQAREDFTQTRNDLRYNLEEAYEDYLDAVEALKVAEINLEATQERAKIARAKYLNGLVDYDEWDRVENTFITSQKALLSHQKTAYLAEASWHKTYGGFVK